MIQDRTIRLIQQSIDGELSTAERKELDKILRTDHDARDLYEDLLHASALLAELRHVDPPQALRPSIMRAIRSSKPSMQAAPHSTNLKEYLMATIQEFFTGPKRIWTVGAVAVAIVAIIVAACVFTMIFYVFHL